MWFKKTKFGGVFEFNNNCLVQFYESFKNIKLLVPIFWGKKKSHNQGTIGGGGGIPFSKSPPPPLMILGGYPMGIIERQHKKM